MIASPLRDTTRTCGRPAIRLAVLCSMLLGLFLMHDSPAAAGAGCHGAMPTTAPMNHAPTMTAHDDHQRTEHASLAQATAAMDGILCVSTPPPHGAPLPAPALAAVLAVGGHLLPGPLRTPHGNRRRGPPLGSRSLLLQACVART
ncbi:hypothetical protein [Streptomyces sp. NPDC048385]|uniref:hypothetical protein n=1 Tax=unclassified Streptomyces TaxID=2593676 RepID=UPI00342FFDDF